MRKNREKALLFAGRTRQTGENEKPPLTAGTVEREAYMIKNVFERSRSHWVRYNRYELKTGKNGRRYITPAKGAKPDVYNPLNMVPDIVLDALNVGMLMMGRKPAAEVEQSDPEIRYPVRLAGSDDRAAYHSFLHGLQGCLSAQEPFHQRGIHEYGPISGAVLSL